jgi:ribosomal protein L37AE/L43A
VNVANYGDGVVDRHKVGLWFCVHCELLNISVAYLTILLKSS